MKKSVKLACHVVPLTTRLFSHWSIPLVHTDTGARGVPGDERHARHGGDAGGGGGAGAALQGAAGQYNLISGIDSVSDPD
jgi:hypothetical protein